MSIGPATTSFCSRSCHEAEDDWKHADKVYQAMTWQRDDIIDNVMRRCGTTCLRLFVYIYIYRERERERERGCEICILL
jgi:hypothetical protein